MELAGKFGIAEAVDPMVEYLRSWDPFGKRRAARLKAIRQSAVAEMKATGLSHAEIGKLLGHLLGALLTLEAMKMEHVLKAPRDGVIADIAVEAGAQVKEGAVLVRLGALEA